MATRRRTTKPKVDPALKKALDFVAKATADQLPAIVTRLRIDENGGQVFNPDGTQDNGVIDGGKWRPLNPLEAAILKRSDELRAGG